MKFRLKLIATSVMAALLFVAFVLELAVLGYADDSQIERLVEKAQTISENFSLALSCEEVIGTETKQDYFRKEEIKIVRFRASPQNILEVRYDSQNKIVSAEVLHNVSLGKAFKCVACIMLVIFFVVSLVLQVWGYEDSETVNLC